MSKNKEHGNFWDDCDSDDIDDDITYTQPLERHCPSELNRELFDAFPHISIEKVESFHFDTEYIVIYDIDDGPCRMSPDQLHHFLEGCDHMRKRLQ